jgi:hypothetical protein
MSVAARDLLVMIAVFATAQQCARSAELVLADKGRSEYQIVLADDASPSTKHAAAVGAF